MLGAADLVVPLAAVVMVALTSATSVDPAHDARVVMHVHTARHGDQAGGVIPTVMFRSTSRCSSRSFQVSKFFSYLYLMSEEEVSRYRHHPPVGLTDCCVLLVPGHVHLLRNSTPTTLITAACFGDNKTPCKRSLLYGGYDCQLCGAAGGHRLQQQGSAPPHVLQDSHEPVDSEATLTLLEGSGVVCRPTHQGPLGNKRIPRFMVERQIYLKVACSPARHSQGTITWTCEHLFPGWQCEGEVMVVYIYMDSEGEVWRLGSSERLLEFKCQCTKNKSVTNKVGRRRRSTTRRPVVRHRTKLANGVRRGTVSSTSRTWPRPLVTRASLRRPSLTNTRAQSRPVRIRRPSLMRRHPSRPSMKAPSPPVPSTSPASVVSTTGLPRINTSETSDSVTSLMSSAGRSYIPLPTRRTAGRAGSRGRDVVRGRMWRQGSHTTRPHGVRQRARGQDDARGDGAAVDDQGVVVDEGCPYGCTQCSPVNGCLACKPPFFLLLHREGTRQTATCTAACPRGFYKLKKKRNGFCAKCTMRGCVECLGLHYCSACLHDHVNFFGKCIKQPPDNELEELGVFVTRPPLVFPSANGTTDEDDTAPTVTESPPPFNSTTSTTLPFQMTGTTTADTSTVTTRVGTTPPWTTTTERSSGTPARSVVVPETETPAPAVSPGPEGQSLPSPPPDDDGDDLTLCRRRYMRRKGRRREGVDGSDRGKNRRGHKGRRRNNKRRRNRNKNRKIGGSERRGGQSRNNRKPRRRGCRRRRKNKHKDTGRRGTVSPGPKSAGDQHGKDAQGDTPEGEHRQTEKNPRQPEGHESRPVQEKIKLSLLQEPAEDREKRPLQGTKSKKFFYINRPRQIASFKQTQEYIRPKPLFVSGHRVRHARGGRSRKVD